MQSKDWSGFGYLSPDFAPGMPVSQRTWNPPGPNPLADMDPPSQIWTPLPNVPFKHRLYHTWSLILFGSFLPMFFPITTQHSSVKVKKNSHFVLILPHLLASRTVYARIKCEQTAAFELLKLFH